MSAADFVHHDDMRPLESAGMPTAPRGFQPVRHHGRTVNPRRITATRNRSDGGKNNESVYCGN